MPSNDALPPPMPIALPWSFVVQVTRGPDEGLQCTELEPEIVIGRARGCQLRLTDKSVSGRHGIICRRGEEVVYRDLGSKRGSMLFLEGQQHVLGKRSRVYEHTLFGRGELLIGKTALAFSLPNPESENGNSADDLMVTEEPTDRVRLSLDLTEMDTAEPESVGDPRMNLVFRLARELNALTRLEQILQRLTDTCFEAFPPANQLGISMLDGTRLRTILIRTRNLSRPRKGGIVISRSTLQRVIHTREAVLYVRGISGENPTESMILADISSCMCAPLFGQERLLGVMQVDTRKPGIEFTEEDLKLFVVFASHAAFALERASLTESIYRMFDGFVRASVFAIEQRDPVTSGHSGRVADHVDRLARALNQCTETPFADVHLREEELRELRYACLLHDFGKVGVREAILSKRSRLNPDQLAAIRERFSRASNAFHANLLTRAMDQPQRPGTDLDDLKTRVAHQQTSQAHFLASQLEHVVDCATKESLTEDDRERLQQIASTKVREPDGTSFTLITEAEQQALLVSQGNLLPEEWDDMRAHVLHSERFLRQIPWSRDLAGIIEIAGAHHEKLDGSGYPRGLTAEQIPLTARILTIADIYDALTAWDRPYQAALDPASACDVLRAEAENGHLDPQLVNLFIQITLQPSAQTENGLDT